VRTVHGAEQHVLVRLPTVLGVDLSVTHGVVLLWLSAAATFVVLALAFRRRSPVATGAFQNFFESIVEFIEQQVVRENVGREGRLWAPFLLALFFFILFCNLLGLVPVPGLFRPATGDLSVTAGLALIVFALTLGINIRRHGLLGFMGKFVPSGVPRWLAVLIVPIEVVGWLVRPASLAIRLFANMVSGHALIFVFIGLTSAAAFYLKPLPLVGAVVMSGFEIFVCFVQAFIFTMLTGVYIGQAMERHA
jgi:F-type H+-transporting ATPase subunit a